jgi:uncharacterized protein YbcI
MPFEMQTQDPRPESLLASFSRDIVQIYARQMGRGPTKARSFLSGDHALCVLEDVFTRAEQTLIASGHAAQVIEARRGLQEAIHPELIQVAEDRTGRCVRACLGQVDPAADVAIEYFQFERRSSYDEQEPEGTPSFPDGFSGT